MIKRIAAALLCVIMAFTAQTPVFARFYEYGDYSNTSPYAFQFEPDDAVLIYYDDSHYYPYDGEVWAGSNLYVPIYSDYEGELATMQEITDGKVGITYKANRLVDGVELVEVDANFDNLLDPGVYAVVTFSDDYTEISGTSVDVRLVLTVDGVSRQETMVALSDTVKNPVLDLHQNSVYSATRPVVYRTDTYTGETVFDFGDNIRYTTVVARDSRYLLNLDRSEIKTLADMYKKVHIEYYDFIGDHDTFVRDGKLEIPVDRDDFRAKRNANPQIYAYKYQNGSLSAMDAGEISFDSKKDILTIKTNTLETYVLSAQALLQEVDESTDDILRVGYAADDTNEPPISSTPPSASASQAIPQAPAQDADNPITGGDAINAANRGAVNPGTSDQSGLLPAVLLAAASAAILFRLSKKSTSSDKSKGVVQ